MRDGRATARAAVPPAEVPATVVFECTGIINLKAIAG
jgi:hypothetical protein